MSDPRNSSPLRTQIRREVEAEILSILAATREPSDPLAEPLSTSARAPSSTAADGGGLREVIALGADHGGFALKQAIADHLRQRGFSVEDFGTDAAEACDYPVFARRVAQRVAAGGATVGIVVDGAGIGSCMVANKVAGVRAAHCRDVGEAGNAREHNHANVLTFGAATVDPQVALTVVDRFLATPWGGGRHARRVELFETGEASACTSQR